MGNSEIEKLELDLDTLVSEIIVPLRSKEINEEAFKKLFIILEEIESLIEKELYISRNLAGLLFFLYTQVETQAKHAEFPEPIFMKLAKMKNYIRHIFKYIL